MQRRRRKCYSSSKFRFITWLVAVLGTVLVIILIGVGIAALASPDNWSQASVTTIWLALLLVAAVVIAACICNHRAYHFKCLPTRPPLEVWRLLLSEMVADRRSLFYGWSPHLQQELTALLAHNPHYLDHLTSTREAIALYV